NASTSARRTVNYAYDDLNRLISASSSNLGSGSNYSHTYTYNAIGNILSGPAGTYSYAHTTSSYANPHALLSLTSGTSTITYAYDNSGNLTGTTIGTSTLASYTWDYRNRITNSSSSGATSTYAYDSTNQRILLTTGTSTTLYLTVGYNLTGSSTVKQIIANGILLATIDRNGTSTAVSRYVLTDHLGGTNLVTNDSNTVAETLDYYPYGGERISSGQNATDRHYIGERFDASTELNYLNSRYYRSSQGQFLSEDPTHLAIGNPAQVEKLTGQSAQKYLSEPQQLNSYSYARGNPIVNKDPSGNATYIWNNGAGATGADTWDKNTYYQYQDQTLLQSNANQMSSPGYYANLGGFYDLVRNGAEWDFKNKERAYYFFGEDLVDKEAFGNRHYGYVGSSGGFGPDLLRVGAGYAQIMSGNAQLRNARTYFDDPNDTANINSGIKANTNSTQASAGQIATQSTNRQTLGILLNQLVGVLTQLLNALK
ncbi:MAG: RHS repeat-associated core domain-containing protein, partial [Cyanobacteriota bacterium]